MLRQTNEENIYLLVLSRKDKGEKQGWISNVKTLILVTQFFKR